jgi:hypothetical protein
MEALPVGLLGRSSWGGDIMVELKLIRGPNSNDVDKVKKLMSISLDPLVDLFQINRLILANSWHLLFFLK